MDATSPAHGAAACRVIVAHPDDAVRRAVAAPLADAGHPVAEACDGAAALDALRRGPVGLLVACPNLSGGDGVSVVAGARAGADGGPAVLALVPRGDAGAALRAIVEGADDHVAVPADPVDLLVRARAALHGERRRTALEQAAQRRIAVAVAGGALPDEVFDLVAEELARVHDVAGGAVVRFDDGEAAFVGRWSARPGSWPPRELTVPLTSPLPVAGPRRPDEFRAFAGAIPWVLDRDAFHVAAAAPVHVGERLWGAVVVASDGRDPLPPGTRERLARVADLVTLAVGAAEARAELARRAATDPLTGLLNRGVFEERLAEETARARRHGRDLALAIVDLDRFKDVNDLHGHVVGDAVLRETARRLASRAREGDVVARLGGEEFGWLMPETDGMEAWQAAERARAAIAGAPFPEVGRVTLSGGVCELARAEDALDLYRRADTALYWAKRNGRDVVFLYTPEAMQAMGEEERAAELRRGQAFGSIRVLARAVDAKDPSTRRHSERVAGLAGLLAERLGWPAGRVALLREAALVHDVGKIAVPDTVLFKPGRLTAAERAKVSQHAALGAEMLSDVLSPEQTAWVRSHHERWDGAGYPEGLRGEAVPEGARLIHLASAWDVMTSTRPYVAAMSADEALDECRRQAGVQFWPRAVEVLAEAAELRLLDAAALERRAAAPV
ncbi:diguanylate cyclase [Miltoncostaea marina]|uniref:diguanylate cyclase n=1 Tax=Miltoncostaea marina TaxID=2843215 RepID=UPI001C3E6391|nr:diguanylate cyclase [Miltoncostaea marina]